MIVTLRRASLPPDPPAWASDGLLVPMYVGRSGVYRLGRQFAHKGRLVGLEWIRVESPA